jgi:hypothetical protein
MATDTSGNQRVDFVWGNVPMQPNTDRTGTGAQVVVAPNAPQNVAWSGYSVYPSRQLDPALDNHVIAVTGYAGFPMVGVNGATGPTGATGPASPTPLIAPTNAWWNNYMSGRFRFTDIADLPGQLYGPGVSSYNLVITGGSYAGAYQLASAQDDGSFISFTLVSNPFGSNDVRGLGVAGGADAGLASIVAR